MKKIWKWQLEIADVVELDTPDNWQVLHVEVQHEVPCIWALIDPDAPSVKRKIRVCGTGHPIDGSAKLKPLGSFFLSGGDFVFHVFEEIE